MPINLKSPKENLARAIFFSPIGSVVFALLIVGVNFFAGSRHGVPLASTFWALMFGIGATLGYLVGLFGALTVGVPVFKFLQKRQRFEPHYFLAFGFFLGGIVYVGFLNFLLFVIPLVFTGRFPNQIPLTLTSYSAPQILISFLVLGIIGAFQAFLFRNILVKGTDYAD